MAHFAGLVFGVKLDAHECVVLVLSVGVFFTSMEAASEEVVAAGNHSGLVGVSRVGDEKGVPIKVPSGVVINFIASLVVKQDQLEAACLNPPGFLQLAADHVHEPAKCLCQKGVTPAHFRKILVFPNDVAACSVKHKDAFSHDKQELSL